MTGRETLISEGFQFTDAETDDGAYLGLRAFADGTIGLASSLSSDGDIELFLGLDQAKRLQATLGRCVDALQARSDERLRHRVRDTDGATQPEAAQAPSATPPGHDLGWLVRWYADQCDGEWEHDHGVRIETIDNPGWAVEIQVVGTALEDRAFASEELPKGSGDWRESGSNGWWQDISRWHQMRVHEGKWQGYGSPDQLPAIVARFRRWVETGN
jgi:hypothetical protein